MSERRFRVTFHWRDWWAAECVGVIYATALCTLMLGFGLYFGLTESNWFLVFYATGAAIWFFVYCAGWQCLMLGLAALRVICRQAPRDR